MQPREITAHLEKVPGVWEKVSRDGVRLDRHQHQRGWMCYEAGHFRPFVENYFEESRVY